MFYASRSGADLDVNRPVQRNLIQQALTEACKYAGLLIVYRPYDLRRGAARDIATFEVPLIGVAILATSEALGYSQNGN